MTHGSNRPLLLDLFCGAGGAAMGYHRAGFDVIGYDIKPQPRYPFTFVQADAFTCPITGVAFIHASPPCQRHSKTRAILRGKGLECRGTDDGIERIRERLIATGLPYVIENVPGAPLRDPMLLCGTMFGLRVLRHRLFESNIPLTAPRHPKHQGTTNSHRGYSRGGEYITVGGHNYNPEDGRQAMGIDWMRLRDGELNEAIPPAYTEHIGRQLLAALPTPPDGWVWRPRSAMQRKASGVGGKVQDATPSETAPEASVRNGRRSEAAALCAAGSTPASGAIHPPQTQPY